METLKNESVSDLYAKLLESEPKAITNFVPENAAEQRDAFLKGDIEIIQSLKTTISTRR
jgi:hypothetical protein